MAAISGQRVSHAYLFSGPRGCGKTTSARILARCLNCAEGPTPTPCGVCDSCRELARGGSGSLDVVEIDAASHNGVDDARELRERAAFAPARDQFKIFILDEAHMVTTQGFNALLKLVEEPPPHVKFIFATTEPDKVIGTIRSRTHHYPFRLVPPATLQAYLERICTAEGVEVGAGVLPLVVRAGGGSVRDSLSVLDQLLAGADGALDYAQAVALLGYTPATLLDDAVEALAAADGAAVFRVVDRVMESGHEPRRFVEDLLQRLRDLIVVVAAGERAADVLRGVPEDQFERMRRQADHLGLAQLSRAADLTNTALTEMTGATSPRLQLELLCARLLLPAADEPLRGYGARIERLEQRVAAGGTTTPPITVAAVTVAPVSASASAPVASPRLPVARVQPDPAVEVPTTAPAATSEPAGGPAASVPPAAPAPSAPTQPVRDSGGAASPTGPASSGLDTETVRRRWPEVLETLSRLRRPTWILVSQNAQVAALDGAVLKLHFTTPGLVSTFRNGTHAPAVEQAVRETLGAAVKVQAVADEGGAGSAAAPPAARRGAATRPASGGGAPDHAARAAADWASVGAPKANQSESARTGATPPADRPGPASPPATPAETRFAPAAAPGPAPSARPSSAEAASSARGVAPSSAADLPAAPEPTAPPARPSGDVRRAPRLEDIPPAEPPDWEPPPFDDEPDFDDPDLDDSSLVGAPLVQKLLGATIIDDIALRPGGSPSPGAP